ncbi:MAG TPA: hypothetical protein DDY49_10240 [Paenibacillaceae bacterium]|nr:hypothetical protein [Paenibacillaceae bacterium]
MATWDLRGTKHHLLICNGGSCMRNGGEELTQAIREEITRLEGDVAVHTTRTKCNGRCQDACVVICYPEGNWYKGMTVEEGRELVKSLVTTGKPLSSSLSYMFAAGEMKAEEYTILGKKK